MRAACLRWWLGRDGQRALSWCLGVLFVLMTGLPAAAQTDAPTCIGSANPDVLTVGIRSFPPFVVIAPNDPPSGLSIELWERVERDLVRRGVILSAEYVVCESLDEIGQALARGDLDVVVAPLTITAERMALYDFSQSYFLSGLTIADRETGTLAFEEAIETLVSSLFHEGTLRAVLAFLVFNVVLALLIRWLLRDAAEREAGRGLTGFGSSFAEAVERTLGLKGLSDRAASAAGRVLEIFMAIAGALLSAAFLGVLTTSFVSALGQGTVVPPEDLPGMRIAAVEGSTAAAFLAELYRADGGRMACGSNPLPPGEPGCVLVQRLPDAIDTMLDDGADAVLGDWAALSWHERGRRYGGRIRVEPVIYRNDPFGWGLTPTRPDLRRAVDAALIAQIRHPDWRQRVERHLGGGSISPD
jgi:ABC-type amino acid transport substrate-binding protein